MRGLVLSITSSIATTLWGLRIHYAEHDAQHFVLGSTSPELVAKSLLPSCRHSSFEGNNVWHVNLRHGVGGVGERCIWSM